MAAGNSAFTLQGSNPQQLLSSYQANNPTNLNLGGNSPISRALSSASSMTLGSPTASTPLKKTTTNNVDGSSTVHEYHAPAAPGSPQAAASQQQKDMQTYFPGLISGGSSSSAPAAPPQTPYQQTTSGLLNNASTPNPTVQTAASTLNSVGQGTNTNNPNTANALAANQRLQTLSTTPNPQVDAANSALNRFNQQSPYALAAQYNPNVAADVASGRDALLGRTFAAEQQALQTGVQNALTGQGQQITAANEAAGNALTGQGQQVTAAQGAGSLANTAQANQINALGTVGGLIPEALRFGGANGGSALDPNTAAASLAQKVVNGQMTYDDAASSLGYAGAAGQQFLNNAIQSIKPGFNIPVARGQAAANQANTTTAGTAATNAYASSYAQNYPKALEIQGYLKNVQDLGQLLVDTATGASVNPFNLTYANDTLNAFKSKLSDSGQAQFANTLATYQGAVSQLLSGSTSVNPTQVAQWTQDIANGSMKLSTLKDVYNQALREGNIKLNTAQTLTNIPGQQIGAPAVSGGQAGTKGQTSGGNGYTIIP